MQLIDEEAHRQKSMKIWFGDPTPEILPSRLA
jgi:hypothetical protein